MDKTQFYTYLWLREDGTPYYVGKGTGDRGFVSEGHGVHRPPNRERIVIYPAVSEADAFESEIALIWYYGRKDLGAGCLRNLTNGGEGQSGLVHTSETKEKMRQAHLGNKYSVGRQHSAYTISKMVASRTGGKRSEETKKKMGASRALWWANKKAKGATA